jgi:hypothetical protein
MNLRPTSHYLSRSNVVYEVIMFTTYIACMWIFSITLKKEQVIGENIFSLTPFMVSFFFTLGQNLQDHCWLHFASSDTAGVL